MHKPQKVRSIYSELKNALPEDFSDYEILTAANHLVSIHDETNDTTPVTHRTQPYIFEEWPLDQAFKDGGWRVLRREKSWVNKSLFGGQTGINAEQRTRERLSEFGL